MIKKFIPVFLAILLALLFLWKCVRGCELLVLNRTDTDEARGQYGRYDVVIVKPDNWKWGNHETNKELFLIVKLPNVSEKNAQKYLEVKTDVDGNILKRRVYKFDTTILSLSKQTELEEKGIVSLTVNKTELEGIIRDKAVIALEEIEP